MGDEKATADSRPRVVVVKPKREPGLTRAQKELLLKPVALATVAVTVAFEWGLASAIREEVFHLPGAAEAAEFVRSVIEEGFWLKGQGQDPEYTFIPWHRVLTVRAPEGVAAAMSERKVAG